MANFCGYDYNISYAKLVKNLLNKDLDKDWQRSDWQKRPLHKEQLKYALLDVVYLLEAYQLLEKKLASLGKASWFSQEMDYSLNRNYDTDNQDLFKKFPLTNKNQSFQDNLKLLIPWRDALAKKRNLPRSYILKDDLLSKISAVNPNSLEAIDQCLPGDKFINSRLKKEILALLQSKEPDIYSDVVTNKVISRLNEEQELLYQKTRVLLQKKAKAFNLKAEFIINQNDLRQIILNHKSPAQVLQGWRFEVLGPELEEMILNK
jgi:ribonuclease D